MTKAELWARYHALMEKYNLFYRTYGRWSETVDRQTRAMGLNNYALRNELPVYQRGEGIKCALQILEWNLARKISVGHVIKILTEQAHERSCTPEFLAGVNMVLRDVHAEWLEPFDPNWVLDGVTLDPGITVRPLFSLAGEKDG